MAARRIIRPGLSSTRDGFSADAVEDLLIGMAAAWAQEDPSFDVVPLLTELRRERHFELLLEAAWVLRQSTDELQRDRAKRALASSRDARPVVVLGLRVPGLAPTAVELCAARNELDALYSLLVVPGSSGVDRNTIAWRIGLSLQRREYAETGGWTYVLGVEHRRRFYALLAHPEAGVRRAIADTLRNFIWEDQLRDETLEALAPHLDDPDIVTAACEAIGRARAEHLAPRLRAIIDTTADRNAVLNALLELGDLGGVLAVFDRCTVEERTQLLWRLGRTARGRRFLIERVGDESQPLALRRDMYVTLVSNGEANAVAHLAWLATAS